MDNPNSIAAYIRDHVEGVIIKGIEPKAIYLGIEEHSAFTTWINSQFFRLDPSVLMEFMGIRIYRVVEQSHIGVA